MTPSVQPTGAPPTTSPLSTASGTAESGHPGAFAQMLQSAGTGSEARRGPQDAASETGPQPSPDRSAPPHKTAGAQAQAKADAQAAEAAAAERAGGDADKAAEGDEATADAAWFSGLLAAAPPAAGVAKGLPAEGAGVLRRAGGTNDSKAAKALPDDRHLPVADAPRSRLPGRPGPGGPTLPGGGLQTAPGKLAPELSNQPQTPWAPGGPQAPQLPLVPAPPLAALPPQNLPDVIAPPGALGPPLVDNLPTPAGLPRGGEARLDSGPGQPGFASHLGATVATFVRDGVQHARLHLNPAEMGPVAVQIRLDGLSAQVLLSAEQPLTRSALEQAMPVLAAQLREAGLTLAGGGVFDQPQPGAGQGRDDSAGDNRGDKRGDGRAAPALTVEPAAPAAVQRRGVVDLVA